MSLEFERAFDFVDLAALPPKPRTTGLIEVRGAYYEAFTVGQWQDLLETWGFYIDGLKFAGGVQALMTKAIIKRFIELAHKHQVYVNTGGFLERVLIQQSPHIDDYLSESKELGFDVIEVSSGMFEHAEDFKLEDQVKIIQKIEALGMKAKPEVTIMSGVGGGVQEFGYRKHITASKTSARLLEEAQQFLDAGAFMLMVESEGITEGIADPDNWRKDVIFALIEKFGSEKLMFEVSPEDDEARKTFKWYLQNIGKDINLMMNSKNIIEFNAWRLNLWGNRELWQGKKINMD
ncbi:phosphosulfolactate synthase [Legionella jordanis]|uniref:(2R)-phospho-3-sulfolactate synthase (ComA) n=1 Tax=Legionella jordanis TaxID=456 RepID=A0A0W0VB20_9GAMM|nr:phosphosulfolactate synthase [Legionella jordanis]KTD17300.1 (2R)-phospho-3-sulfolactate synthase (ComA) [Legionella jordanis]RMW99457.1 phosphosulfolactate synthase [Legionella jordanis]RMX15306.1 phosphosulfolactate synthase [Legionella jordanis]VEH12501.1 phosphosulfolactate synthase [Legionella jordanis]